MKKMNNKGWFTLIEMIIVVTLIIILIAALYPKFAGYISKQRDVWRIKVLQDISWDFESIKQSVWRYPNANLHWTAGLKAKAKLIDSAAVWTSGRAVLIKFSKDDNDKYIDSGNPSPTSLSNKVEEYINVMKDMGKEDIKALPEEEELIIFTSKTWQRMVGCVKLFADNATAAEDGDGIEDTDNTDINNPSGSRIYVNGDMQLWNQLWDAARDLCKKLEDPREL